MLSVPQFIRTGVLFFSFMLISFTFVMRLLNKLGMNKNVKTERYEMTRHRHFCNHLRRNLTR